MPEESCCAEVNGMGRSWRPRFLRMFLKVLVCAQKKPLVLLQFYKVLHLGASYRNGKRFKFGLQAGVFTRCLQDTAGLG